LRLALQHHPGGAELTGPNAILYDVSAGAGQFAPARVQGEALSWALVGDNDAPSAALLVRGVELDPESEWLMRCDRVEFIPGGVAHRHVHPGPGIRYLLYGQITIHSGGAVDTYDPGQAWFERGPEPVLAETSPTEPSAFVRVLLLPVAYAGQRTIRYVDPADAEKPKTQKATVFCEAPVRATAT
jgi:quercetin dioxygenase-like cupin family protein